MAAGSPSLRDKKGPLVAIAHPSSSSAPDVCLAGRLRPPTSDPQVAIQDYGRMSACVSSGGLGALDHLERLPFN